MIKATAIVKGHETLLLGLSFENLDRLRAAPGDSGIKIDGKEMGLTFNVLIFSGETEAHLTTMIQHGIGPRTKVHIDPKLKA